MAFEKMFDRDEAWREQAIDEWAVDQTADDMKVKLGIKRAEGRGGWHDELECTTYQLMTMLHDHVERGDWLDVCTLAMMLHMRA